MSLLRQWPLLEGLLIPVLMASRPQAQPVVVWSLGCLDTAAALVLAYFHCGLPDRLGDVTVYHSGPLPPEPVEWRSADIRPLPSKDWLEPVAERPGRWAPRRELLERVILGEPPGVPDVVAACDLPLADDGLAHPALRRLRRDGHLFLHERGGRPASNPRGFKAADRAGHVFVKTDPGDPAAPDPPAAPADRTLARRDQEARLVSSYMGLATALARRYRNRGERPEDLEQVATLALVKAARRYSPELGSFASFATTSILGELKRHFRDRLWMVRPPRQMQELHLAIRSARDELAQAQGASPTIAQIADHLDTTEEAVLAAMDAAANCWATSLDAPNPQTDSAVTEVPVHEDGFDRSLDHHLLQEAIPHLSPMEKLMVKRLYFDGDTQRQLARELGVSQMQVSRLMAKTLSNLRQACETA
jgi:RNA polymerase sigma-B factor